MFFNSIKQNCLKLDVVERNITKLKSPDINLNETEIFVSVLCVVELLKMIHVTTVDILTLEDLS